MECDEFEGCTNLSEVSSNLSNVLSAAVAMLQGGETTTGAAGEGGATARGSSEGETATTE